MEGLRPAPTSKRGTGKRTAGSGGGWTGKAALVLSLLALTVSGVVLYLLLFLAGGILICAIDGIPMMAALFETASAIGTVGLSLAGTAELSVPSRLILMCLMYFGRVGGLTLIYAVSTNGKNTAQYPVEQVTVG